MVQIVSVIKNKRIENNKGSFLFNGRYVYLLISTDRDVLLRLGSLSLRNNCILNLTFCNLVSNIRLLFQAELYRVNKAFDKAEPLYLKAIDILEETFGPEDIRYTMIIKQSRQSITYFHHVKES